MVGKTYQGNLIQTSLAVHDISLEKSTRVHLLPRLCYVPPSLHLTTPKLNIKLQHLCFLFMESYREILT